MKRLDLSCLPLKLDVGEVMEVIDHEGKYHLIKCVQSKNGGSWCEGCFFAKTAKNFSCTQIKCSKREREQDVRFIELPAKNEFKEEEENNMKTLTFEDLRMKQKKVRDFEVFKVVHPITANEVTIQAIPRDTISCNGCAFRKGDLESMCKAYLCFSERTLDCLVFKKVKYKFKRNVTEF